MTMLLLILLVLICAAGIGAAIRFAVVAKGKKKHLQQLGLTERKDQ